jgi:hypothetical protein
MAEMDLHLLTMLKEYVDFVDAFNSGDYEGSIQGLDSQRLVLHEQLLQYTGLTRATDMYRYAKDQMHLARMAGYVAGHDY